eukprot:CAMPEP_0197669054 /NCGR_PEP_ID=MMETSP1338-20131121/70996_1 /TAXON_ID=43686 ORGANISM="Pelagodinium beii, Strain RCC1491" /NCGR_SAMPLE_ID=MMETSP1338 /ASSEMBLY_ACC=CAM_ASM_000754 /LENGTH=75 /DNA_ID=CAMNT_0043248541 /DNA_START=342 /DNA_END=566 /DNA_ORIENTATION=-
MSTSTPFLRIWGTSDETTSASTSLLSLSMTSPERCGTASKPLVLAAPKPLVLAKAAESEKNKAHIANAVANTQCL